MFDEVSALKRDSFNVEMGRKGEVCGSKYGKIIRSP